MNALTITLGTIGVLLSLVCWFAFISGALKMVNTVRIGQPAPDRWRPFFPRFKQMVVEFLAHTKMVKFRTVGWAHWLVMVGFLLGSIVWFEAYGQTFDPEFHWPLIGDTAVYHFIDEILGLGTVIGILVLIYIRQRNHPRQPGRLSRFSGSNFKAAYFVETVVLLEGLGMILVKAGKIATFHHYNAYTDFFTMQVAKILPESPELVSVFAFVKLMSGMVWLYIVGRNITWGVAWHRFSAFFNIYFKREDDGGPALGAARQMMSGGKPVDMEDADPDKDTFGAGRIEDFTWKGWLDFTTCTECGRCQSQCPAWNTGKPLSPKLLITSLRDHGYAKAPYLLAGGRTDIGGDEVGLVDAEGNPDEAKLAKIPASAREESRRKLVGETEALVEADELAPVIDTETLWSCTNCGACVEQCPVDIEHVDHIIDMRRYQVLIESDFPSELAGLFKNLENKGNPWGQNAKDRLNWINELEFEIPVFGQDAETFDGYEYLFWVGCAGAYEDRAKKTTKAVAELLATAGVKFMVLGAEETCTGDSARRAGNEFLFQQLAQQNIEVLNGVFEGVEQSKRKIVVTCAHCFNALNNEYPQVGGTYEVVHHTQLLNRLVRAKKLVQVKPVGQNVTYHDPCFLGRHNKVYNAPRELMAASGATLVEMPRHGERSMCCGAGGARMWMEEKIGKRINIDRVDEALTTDPAKIATGCPFCRVMLTDGVTARQEQGQGEGVEVVDVAQLMLESIERVEAGKLSENLKVVQQPKAPVEVEEKAEEIEQERVEEVEAAAAAPTTPKTTGAPKAGGLQMKGGLKAPGAKAPGGAKPAAESAEAPAAPKAKPGGLQLKGGLKGPGAKKAAAPAASAASVEAPAAEAPAAPKAKPGGLQMKGGLKAPGAKAPGGAKPAAPAASAPAAEAPAEAPQETAIPKAKPGGLQLKSGLKGPGARKPAAPQAAAPAAPAEPAPAAEAPAAEAPAEAPKEAAIPKAKPGGLQLKSGLKGPGIKKAPAAPAPAPEPAPEPEAPAEPEAPVAEAAPETLVAEAPAAPAKPEPEAPKAKPGALGFKPGAKAPGRR
ncbi:heterodisulfide reductase-related iron-sulfur binding cluster [Rhodococcus sp. Z13]|uniref:Heterodisulfide reductase-related iron-sulfur binding cluster n=1 Tax=Rhodococcus sacchari TaxID=2962047 RepID=A0ACD4DEH3_9NOCA|nr:heterodisulfide reductase-related iron-sulfur binding cluster [Rhodococcus sp. Z13]UYP18441.1 heterodisulfide reductase-related iron-sulfur binding cluster [Rhodococcus sp. Z13]